MILIDCPPALGLLTINGLVAADWALISSEAQYFALQGVNGALEVIEQAREYYNDDLEFLGVLMNIADMRTTHSRDAYTQLQEAFGEKVFETVIRASIAYAESAEKALSILEYRPDLGADYLALADEVLSRIGREDARARLSYTDAGRWGSASSTATTRRRSRASWRSGCPSTRTSSTPARRTPPRRALAALPEARPDVVLLDTLGKPGDDTLLLAIREVAPGRKVIVYSGYVRLMQEGALGAGGRRLPREGRRRRPAARRHPRRREARIS